MALTESQNPDRPGRSLLAGNFEAAKARNPKLVSWNTTGPVWGGADGCTFRLVFNTQKAPFDSVEVRQAINSAISRDHTGATTIGDNGQAIPGEGAEGTRIVQHARRGK